MGTLEIIKDKREQLGISIKELSDALGMGINGESVIRAWESGKAKPDNEMLIHCC